MSLDLEKIYERLYSYCESQGFAGHDPFDGLNSILFQHSPLKYSETARLAWLQMVKRSPVDLRRVLSVPKGVNPKALALFALAELSRFRSTGNETHLRNASELVKRMLATKILGKTKDDEPTTAFGYNFDWQSRNFFAPFGMPAIVPTAFASRALIELFQENEDTKYLDEAKAICRFILNGLNRSVGGDDEICFSYTPVDRTIIFNASLLAGESLARVGAIEGNAECLETAAETVRFVVRRQRNDGAWAYGATDAQAWVDNFHTAYVLLSLHRISTLVPDLGSEVSDSIKRGIEYWLQNFFLGDGTPKYYDKGVYPIDIHSAAAAIAALSELSSIDARMLTLAEKTARWTVSNMLDEKGYFYYQVRKDRNIKTPFMRWGQAWMAYALARLMERLFEQATKLESEN